MELRRELMPKGKREGEATFPDIPYGRGHSLRMHNASKYSPGIACYGGVGGGESFASKVEVLGG